MRLTEAAKELAQGTRGVQVSIHSGDELETLGASFNAMVEELDRSYAELLKRPFTSGELLARAAELIGAPPTKPPPPTD